MKNITDETNRIAAEHKAGRNALSGKFRLMALEHAAASNQQLVAGAAKDVAAALASNCSYDLDSDALQVLGADGKPRVDAVGKPLGVDAVISEYVSARPYLHKDDGLVAAGVGKKAAGAGRTMTIDAYKQLRATAQGAFFQNGGKLVE